jgi:hypothetical protein
VVDRFLKDAFSSPEVEGETPVSDDVSTPRENEFIPKTLID